MAKAKKAYPEITALRVRQWLPQWDQIKFDADSFQSKPDPFFYMCSIKARDLKALTGVYRRSTKGGLARSKDPNVQRWHEEERSRTIRQYVEYGFPWCEMSDAKRELPGAKGLQKPGWLPTAIIINILKPGSVRNEKIISEDDTVAIVETGSDIRLRLPKGFEEETWEPKNIFPLEIIDGQHRLWAFEDFKSDDFELPVIAFHGLDRSWQAYLFWSVNITPKKINRSLAFDLYPLLRKEEWLDRFAGHSIYRETRCQELVESLWSHPKSPWYQRINMLGETVQQRGNQIPMVTQAAWIRSLMATFVKEASHELDSIGGLFGAPRSKDEPLLPWNRAMQAAFLIHAGNAIRESVGESKETWTRTLRELSSSLFDKEDDLAFYGEYSLLTTDQGIRGILFTINDLCYVARDPLDLDNWRWDDISKSANVKAPATDEEAVALALKSLAHEKVGKFVRDVSRALATYDWRTSSTPGLSDKERLRQAVFRGSSGYRELRRQLLGHVAGSAGAVAKAAEAAIEILEF